VFKNILIPISSEFYSKDVLERGAYLAEKFKSTLNLIYIIEEKTFNHTDKLVNSYRTAIEKEEYKKQIITTQVQVADQIVFEDAKKILKNKKIAFEEKIIEGEYTDKIKQELTKKQYDLILMGFEKECSLNYRLFEEVQVPVWIEGKGTSKKILAICSNLAPNQKVPNISIKLAQNLGWKLHILYVVDTEDRIQVDKNGTRSDTKTEQDLLEKGKKFLDKIKNQKITTELVKGSLEKQTIKKAKEINANLVIVGREQKKKGILGLPVKNIKRKLAEKCEYSILFIN
jgi:nucleotide-binding universal stress UspA family protein